MQVSRLVVSGHRARRADVEWHRLLLFYYQRSAVHSQPNGQPPKATQVGRHPRLRRSATCCGSHAEESPNNRYARDKRIAHAQPSFKKVYRSKIDIYNGSTTTFRNDAALL